MEIYDELWKNDSNGFSVSGRKVNGDWEDPDADILLDEQVKASGKRQLDLASRSLFAFVRDERFECGIYASFLRLLDNYAVHFRDPEVTTPAEQREIDSFVDLTLRSTPMTIAYDYVSRRLGLGVSRDQFRKAINRLWFEPYTNHYKGKSVHFASGFEHVFVGEGKFERRNGPQETKGEISGYHSWVKFYLDEAAGRVNFLGYKYDLNGRQGAGNPNVVTLQMTWNHIDLNGELQAMLFKRKGGFFVGSSPECEMAMGTVAFYESIAGRLAGDKRRARIGDDDYELVLYRNTREDGGRGLHIRSFYPVFLSTDGGVRPDTDETSVTPVGDASRNAGPVRINRAMPNPAGDDQTGEWVEVKNVTDEEIDLTDWELRDRLSRPRPLEGKLAAREARTFESARADFQMMLSNKSGVITLHRASDLIATVSYKKAKEAEPIEF
ncbi:MAG: endoribonuclease [bacterium]|nr:endoribonuclease [bacterium]